MAASKRNPRVDGAGAREAVHAGTLNRTEHKPASDEPQLHPAVLPVVIVMWPAGSPGRYQATLDGETLCISRQPFFTAARTLVARGFLADALLVMRWRGSFADALRGKLGEVAQLTVIENDRTGPASRRYTPPPKFCSPAQGVARDGDFGSRAIPLPSHALRAVTAGAQMTEAPSPNLRKGHPQWSGSTSGKRQLCRSPCSMESSSNPPAGGPAVNAPLHAEHGQRPDGSIEDAPEPPFDEIQP
jgi:hypothetical protein